MAQNSPTIVMASLDDAKLQQSIKKMVEDFNTSLNTMVQSADQKVAEINSKLSGIKIGTTKSGSANATSTKSDTQAVEEHTNALKKGTQATKERTMSFDQMAKAQQQAVNSAKSYTEVINQQIQAINSAATAKKALASVMAMPTENQEQGMAKIEAMIALRQKLANTPFASKRVLGDIDGALTTLRLEYDKTFADAENSQKRAKDATHQLSEETKELAKSIRAYFAAYKQESQYHIRNASGGDSIVYAENDARAKGLTIEQQLNKIYEEGIALSNQRRGEKQAELAIEQQITEEVRKRKSYKTPALREPENYQAAISGIANKLNIKENQVLFADASISSIKRLNEALKQTQDAYAKLNAEERNSNVGKAIRERFQELSHDVQRFRKEMSTPINLKSALSGSEKSLDEIAYKIQRLRLYKQSIDPAKRGADTEIRQINNELARLQKTADNWMGKQEEMIKKNTALGRSWNYMKNRLAFYFTVGASTQFVKQLIDVRSQYEMNERALGILIDSAERGTRIFNELSQMSLVSPYTLIELSTAAKQLSAYDIAAKDVVDTTRRLADMAAAVGIPIERLTYALGQIKAYGYLNSRDARMFSNAGIPLVKQLAEYYTQLEGRLVSTADVYDRIKKKTVDFEEVVNVIHHMTDEGGKFFDFQAKMADTLKVRLANLGLAWNNMLNDMGEESEGVLRGGIGVLRDLFASWKDVKHYVEEAVVAFGAYKVVQLLIAQTTGVAARSMTSEILAMKQTEVELLRKKALTRELTATEKTMIATSKIVTATDYQNALSTKNLTKQKALLLAAFNMNNKALITALIRMGLLTAAEVRSMTVGKALTVVFKSMGLAIASAARAIGAFLASNWVFILIGAAYELYHAFDSASEHIKDINRGLIEDAKNTFKDLKEFLDSSSPIRVKIKAGKLDDAEAQKAWEELRERIETLTPNSAVYLSKLMGEEDLKKRLEDGYKIIEMLTHVEGVVKNIREDAIKADETKWGGLLGKGLQDHIKDNLELLDQLIEKYGSLDAVQQKIKGFNPDFAWLSDDQMGKFVGSVAEAALGDNLSVEEQREFLEKTIQKVATESKLSAEETRIFRINAERSYYMELDRQRKKGANIDMKAAYQEFYVRKNLQQEFFTWLSEVHSSETQKRISNASEEEIKNGEWLTEENKRWIKERAKEFSDKYRVSFNELNGLVQEANTWSIYIPVYFQTAKDSLSEFQEDFFKRAKETFGQNKEMAKQVFAGVLPEKDDAFPKWVKERQEAIKKLGEDRKKYERDETAWSQEHRKQIDAEIKANKQALDLYHQPYEEPKDKKGGKKRDEILDALKNEIDLIKKAQSEYETLTQKGYSSAEALASAQSKFGKTLTLLNDKMRFWGLPTIDLRKIIKGDPNKTLAFFEKVRDMLESKGLSNIERMKALEVVIDEFDLKAKTFNIEQITKGIEKELKKLKEEYELAIDIDANPEESEILADFLQLDRKKLAELPRSFAQLMARLQEKIDKQLQGKGLKFNLSEMLNKENFEKWVADNGHTLEDGMTKSLDAIREHLNKLLKDETKQLGTLVSKYGEASAKIEKIYSQSTRRLLSVITTYGESDDKSAGINLADKLSVSSNPETVTRLRDELRRLAQTVVDKSQGDAAMNLLDAVLKNEKENVAKALWEGFKDGDYYSVIFDDVKRASTTALQAMKTQLDDLKDKVKESPESMKALMSAYSKLREELIERNPFQGMTDALNNMRLAHQQVLVAMAELANAEKELKQKEAALDTERKKGKGNLYAICRAEKELAKAKKNVAEKSTKVAKAQNDETASQEDYKKAIKAANVVIKKLADSLKQIGDTLDNTTGDVIKFIGDILNFVTVVSESMTTVSQSAAKSIQAIEKASVILAIISAAIQLIQELNSLIPDASDKYQKSAKKQAEINALTYAVMQYRLAVLAAEMEEENWFSTSSLKQLKNFYSIGSEALSDYNKKLMESQSVYQNEQSGGWLTKFAYWTNPATWIQKITGIEGKWADAIALVGSGLMGAEAQMGQLGIWLTQHVNDDVYDYEEGFTAALNNLRIETKARSKGFLGTGIGGHAQETEDLIKWTKEKLGIDLFDKDFMLNEEAYQIIMDKYADKLVGETKATLESLHELTEKWNEYIKQLEEYVDSLYSPLVENMTDAMWAWYDEGKSALDSFREYASDTFRAIVTDMIKSIILSNFAEEYANDIKEMYKTYSKGGMTEEDLIRKVADRTGLMMDAFDKELPVLEGMMNAAGEALEKYGIILRKGSQADQLDNLQAGISAITEDTAGALEALLNGISQQVYLHSDILIQIRDTLLSFNFDANLGVQAQILLQLQSSYQVQMTIQNIMQGWSSPNGMAVRVELAS